MAKPNYAFEKRQRELEKKKKKEAKAYRKGGSNPGDETPEEPQPAVPSETVTPPTAP